MTDLYPTSLLLAEMCWLSRMAHGVVFSNSMWIRISIVAAEAIVASYKLWQMCDNCVGWCGPIVEGSEAASLCSSVGVVTPMNTKLLSPLPDEPSVPFSVTQLLDPPDEPAPLPLRLRIGSPAIMDVACFRPCPVYDISMMLYVAMRRIPNAAPVRFPLLLELRAHWLLCRVYPRRARLRFCWAMR